MMKERECRVGERRTNEGGDGFTLRVLGVGDGVSDDVSGREEKEGGRVSSSSRSRRSEEKRGKYRLTLKEELENTSSLLVDQSRDSLDSSSSRQSSDRRLGDTLRNAERERI